LTSPGILNPILSSLGIRLREFYGTALPVANGLHLTIGLPLVTIVEHWWTIRLHACMPTEMEQLWKSDTPREVIAILLNSGRPLT